MVCVCVFVCIDISGGGCGTSFDPQGSLFYLLLFNVLPQTANYFNYSEAIDLSNELTYSNLQQSHSSLLAHNVRIGTSAVLFSASAVD